jgi:hypothetical protein
VSRKPGQVHGCSIGFPRLLSSKPGDVVELRDGGRAVVETAKLADDLHDAKCAVLAECSVGSWPPGWRRRLN